MATPTTAQTTTEPTAATLQLRALVALLEARWTPTPRPAPLPASVIAACLVRWD